MIDERGASWKMLLPVIPHARMLALGLDIGQLASLARTWHSIDYDCITDQQSMPTLQSELAKRVTQVPAKGYKKSSVYDIIVIGVGGTKDSAEIKQMYTSNLAQNGVIVCIGHSDCDLVKMQLNNSEGIIQKYGVLPQGNPRIIFPLSNHFLRQKGLGFHQPARWQARLGIRVASLLSRFDIVKPLEKGAVLILHNTHQKEEPTLKAWLSSRIGTPVQDLILYCGSDTMQRKITALAVLPGQEDLVVKIADSPSAKKALRCESNALQALAEREYVRFHFPELILEEEWGDYLIQVQTNLTKKKNKQTQKLTDRHLDVLTDLSRIGRRTLEFSETSCYSKIRELSSRQEAGLPEPLAQIATTICTLDFQKARILCHRTHGDFAPWNINKNNHNMSLWDWEDSLEDGLIYTDIFHFIIRQAILVGPWPGAVELLQDIRNGCSLLQGMATLQTDADVTTSLKIWLVLEYLRNPHQRLMEIAVHMKPQDD